MDFLKHEISEIENANLVKGEDEELETVYQKIVHSRDIIISCQAARMLRDMRKKHRLAIS